MEIRRTARILLLDPQFRVLLMKIVDPNLPEGNPGRDRGLWVTLGGGVDDGEEVHEAARRELQEETGVRAEIGPARWYGEQVLTVRGAPRLLKESFFIAQSSDGQYTDIGLEPDERSVVREFRWWSADDLSRTDEAFVPAILPELLREVTDDPTKGPAVPRTIPL